MNWSEISAIGVILGLIASMALWFVKDQMEKGLLRLETKIGEWRAADKTELRDWINGSFMRGREAEARLDAQDHRLEELERRD